MAVHDRVEREGPAMSETGGSGRIQQDVPTASGTGENSDLSTGDPDADAGGTHDGVPLTRDAALQRADAAGDDELPTRASAQPKLTDNARNSTDG
jgi:hypothetical protein